MTTFYKCNLDVIWSNSSNVIIDAAGVCIYKLSLPDNKTFTSLNSDSVILYKDNEPLTIDGNYITCILETPPSLDAGKIILTISPENTQNIRQRDMLSIAFEAEVSA